MSTPGLFDVWAQAGATPYQPALSKESQFTVGFALLLSSFILAGFFSLNPSLQNVPVVGLPASLAFGFGAVYMICAAGVYV